MRLPPLAMLLALALFAAPAPAPAGDAPVYGAEIVMRVRAEVAQLLGKRPADVDPGKSLASQGADELDMVEIIMALEEQFHVSIPDDAIGIDGGAWNTLSVQRLAQIVQKLKRSAPPEL